MVDCDDKIDKIYNNCKHMGSNLIDNINQLGSHYSNSPERVKELLVCLHHYLTPNGINIKNFIIQVVEKNGGNATEFELFIKNKDDDYIRIARSIPDKIMSNIVMGMPYNSDDLT